jgi:tetratricopeptide (TPR) repeat protein
MRTPRAWLALAGLAAFTAAPTGVRAAEEKPRAGGVAKTSGSTATRSDPRVAALLAAADDAYAHRDEPGRLDEVKTKLEEAEKLAPGDFEVLWRLSRLYFWLSDDPKKGDDEKSELGKIGWRYGDQAAQVDPDRPEGHYFAAVSMGNYALALGVISALRQGIEGKFKDRLKAAERIDAAYGEGGIQNAWGRFYFKLPWPKYDAKKSETYLKRAIEANPKNVRARVFLADLYLKEDKKKDAKRLLEEAVALQPGAYDAPEERRSRAQAQSMLSRLQ